MNLHFGKFALIKLSLITLIMGTQYVQFYEVSYINEDCSDSTPYNAAIYSFPTGCLVTPYGGGSVTCTKNQLVFNYFNNSICSGKPFMSSSYLGDGTCYKGSSGNPTFSLVKATRDYCNITVLPENYAKNGYVNSTAYSDEKCSASALIGVEQAALLSTNWPCQELASSPPQSQYSSCVNGLLQISLYNTTDCSGPKYLTTLGGCLPIYGSPGFGQIDDCPVYPVQPPSSGTSLSALGGVIIFALLLFNFLL